MEVELMKSFFVVFNTNNLVKHVLRGKTHTSEWLEKNVNPEVLDQHSLHF